MIQDCTYAIIERDEEEPCNLLYESSWSFDILTFFQKQMISFSVQKIYFNIEKLNEF